MISNANTKQLSGPKFHLGTLTIIYLFGDSCRHGMKLDKVGPGSSRKQAFTVAFRGRGRAGGVEYLFFLVSSFVIKSFQGKGQVHEAR